MSNDWLASFSKVLKRISSGRSSKETVSSPSIWASSRTFSNCLIFPNQSYCNNANLAANYSCKDSELYLLENINLLISQSKSFPSNTFLPCFFWHLIQAPAHSQPWSESEYWKDCKLPMNLLAGVRTEDFQLLEAANGDSFKSLVLNFELLESYTIVNLQHPYSEDVFKIWHNDQV